MRVIHGLVDGPFRNEQEFKRAVLTKWKADHPDSVDFEIENEEKEPGMPDVLSMSGFSPATFTEFKHADARGVIGFKKSQPLFYRKHRNLRIYILAWDGRTGGRAVLIEPSEVLDAKSLRIRLPLDIKEHVMYVPEEGE